MSSGLPIATPPGPPRPLDPIVLLLKEYIAQTSDPRALQEAVDAALGTAIGPQLRDCGITSADGFLNYANELLRWIPHENQQGKDIYETLCVFYFVLDQDPLSALQTQINPSSVGKPLTWLSAWIVCYAQLVGAFMDTSDSITAQSFQSFVNSPKFNIKECVVPPGGFKTFNELFARHLQMGARPIDDPDNPNMIVFPADCTFDGAWKIDPESVVTIKTLPWRIQDLLQESTYHGEFKNGIWMHAFLNTFDYHRQHAPVKGVVKEAKVIQGAAYLEVKVTTGLKGKGPTLTPIRTYEGSGPDAPDSPGYQFLQTRGLIIIDSKELGLVAVLPIGMAQVSSVKLSVKAGDAVEKGQEISYFQFGGSDVVMVFQQSAGLTVDSFPKVHVPPEHSLMGQKLAEANPAPKND
jgi:phosphatidylserine decarboxylase